MSWWHTLGSVWKIVAVVLAGIGAIAGAVAIVRGLLRWAVERRDGVVLELLRGRENVARTLSRPGFVIAEPTTVTFIAGCLKRKPQRVQASLLRLEKRDKVHREPGGWQFGATPQRPTADLERWK